MPNNHLHLSAIFERTSDIIDIETTKVRSASLTVPETEINGNAELVIGDATGVDEESFESKAKILRLYILRSVIKRSYIQRNDRGYVRTNITELNENTTVTLTC